MASLLWKSTTRVSCVINNDMHGSSISYLVDQWLISKGNSKVCLLLAVPQACFAQAGKDADDEAGDDNEEEDEASDDE